MLVGTHEHEFSRIEGLRSGFINVEEGKRDTALRGRGDNARDAYAWGETDEREIRSERFRARGPHVRAQTQRERFRTARAVRKRGLVSQEIETTPPWPRSSVRLIGCDRMEMEQFTGTDIALLSVRT